MHSKRHILSLFPTLLMNSIKQEHSCKNASMDSISHYVKLKYSLSPPVKMRVMF